MASEHHCAEPLTISSRYVHIFRESLLQTADFLDPEKQSKTCHSLALYSTSSSSCMNETVVCARASVWCMCVCVFVDVVYGFCFQY